MKSEAAADSLYLSAFLRRSGIFLLALLPFERLPYAIFRVESLEVFNYLDEIAFIFFAFSALTFFLMKPQSFKFPSLPVNTWLLAFIGYALFFVFAKQVPPAQGLFGIYDSLKNILVFLPFACLRFSEEEFIRALKTLTWLALFLAVAGIAFELLAIGWGWGVEVFVSSERDRRFGLYRIYSLTGIGSHNYLAIYTIFFFFLALAMRRKGLVDVFKLSTLLILLALTFSRQAWVGFVVMLGVRSRRFLPLTLMSLALLVLYLLPEQRGLENPEGFFRTAVLSKSLEILAENPLTGIGAGMYGGLASILWESPAYDSLPSFWRMWIFDMRTIDMYWPSVWAEYGLLGLTVYAGIWVSLFLSLKKKAQSFKAAGNSRLFRVGSVLQYYILVLVIMGTASGLNAAFVVFTYFALVGIFLSLPVKSTTQESEPSGQEDLPTALEQHAPSVSQ